MTFQNQAWLNWAIYIIAFISVSFALIVGSFVMKRRWLLLLSAGHVYWAIGSGLGAFQAGQDGNGLGQEIIPYIRSLWLLGSIAMIVSLVAYFTDFFIDRNGKETWSQKH